MEQILEEFGEEFAITGKRLGWYIGQWKGNGGWTVMLKSIDKVDFVSRHFSKYADTKTLLYR